MENAPLSPTPSFVILIFYTLFFIYLNYAQLQNSLSVIYKWMGGKRPFFISFFLYMYKIIKYIILYS